MTIVIIDDNLEDIQRISKALRPLQDMSQLQILSYSSLEEKNIHIRKDTDLILLDLEFTALGRTSIYFMDHLDPSIPILIVSHLTHYQRQLTLKANVVGFVPKQKIEELLVPTILNVMTKNQPKPEKFIMPVASEQALPRGFTVKDILYIETVSYRHYRIVLVNKEPILLPSVSFQQLCAKIKKQNIAELYPVSRNQIINTNYINEVYHTKNGRLAVSLMGVAFPFIVGKNYLSYYRSWFLE